MYILNCIVFPIGTLHSACFVLANSCCGEGIVRLCSLCNLSMLLCTSGKVHVIIAVNVLTICLALLFLHIGNAILAVVNDLGILVLFFCTKVFLFFRGIAVLFKNVMFVKLGMHFLA